MCFIHSVKPIVFFLIARVYSNYGHIDVLRNRFPVLSSFIDIHYLYFITQNKTDCTLAIPAYGIMSVCLSFLVFFLVNLSIKPLGASSFSMVLDTRTYGKCCHK